LIVTVDVSAPAAWPNVVSRKGWKPVWKIIPLVATAMLRRPSPGSATLEKPAMEK
jgi:hypothetical protein